jgi:hypothetical protein
MGKERQRSQVAGYSRSYSEQSTPKHRINKKLVQARWILGFLHINFTSPGVVNLKIKNTESRFHMILNFQSKSRDRVIRYILWPHSSIIPNLLLFQNKNFYCIHHSIFILKMLINICLLNISMAMLWLKWLVASLSLRRPRFAPMSVHVEFVVKKVALWQVHLRVLQFSPVNIIPPWLSIFMYHLVDEQ